MKKEIEIEEVKNQKIEKVPLFQTYYQIFTREEGTEWFGGITSTSKDIIISNVRTYYKNSHEVKIISFELPF